ncbi:MAG: peptidylprolyl isomerase [Dehalococcoidia bacterium]|nr:peptidylprolyl isomerase [Dehalococcoidia bacterium]
MAREKQSALSRREQREAADRRQRLITTGVIGALAVVGGIIAVGLYVTQYQAPRAHVLTVEGRDYSTSDVARRGTYYALFEGGYQQGTAGLVSATVALLVDDEVYRRRAPALVGAVGDAEVEQDLRARYGLEDSADRKQFADSLQAELRNSGLSQQEYYDIIAARLLRARVAESLRETLSPIAEQVRLARIRLVGSGEAEEVRELALGGADFAELVLERTADSDNRENEGDLGWFMLELLDAEVAEAVTDLEAGAVTAVIPSGLFFDVYIVWEREPERELDEAQTAELTGRLLNDWREQERALVAITFDLSIGEEEWIVNRVVGDVSAVLDQ